MTVVAKSLNQTINRESYQNLDRVRHGEQHIQEDTANHAEGN